MAHKKAGGSSRNGRDTAGQPNLGRVENDRFVDMVLVGGVSATNFNFGERGLRPVNSISGVVFVDVNNLFDEEPPFVNTSGGFSSAEASPIGRVVTVGFRKRW